MLSILNRITAKRYMMIMNLSLLLVHAILLTLFAVLHVTTMVYVNVASIVCYCICFLLVKHELITELIYITYVEVLIHGVLATYCVGGGPAFQVYFVGCIAVTFSTQYFSAHFGIKPFSAVRMSLVCGVVYIFSQILDWVHTPLYPLSERVVFGLAVTNSVVLFTFTISAFGLLTYVASNFEAQLARQASHDSLTGLVNRHYLTKYINDIYQSENMENYWLAILDIDNFKMVNDRYGHLCGDFVLCSVAEILKACCGERIVCRWGGEEFMIVGNAPEQESSVKALLEKVRSTIAAKEFSYNDNTKLNLTVTIGTAYYQKGQPADAWVNVADSRLYSGKQTGKNRVISE